MAFIRGKLISLLSFIILVLGTNSESSNDSKTFTRANISSEKTYLRYNEMKEYLNQLATKHNKIMSVTTIGNSSEDREIFLVKISHKGVAGRPVILIDAGIHGREWVAPAMALHIIWELVENPENIDLIDKVEWHIIPLLNPDGYEYSHTTKRSWLKTCSKERQDETFATKLCGANLNRNFDFLWNAVGTSARHCRPTSAGATAFSEPEAEALRDHVRPNARLIKLYLSLHAPGNQILYPWSYTTVRASNWRHMHSVASKANSAIKEAGGQEYAIGSFGRILYKASGTSTDWMFGVVNVQLSYTIRLPGGGSSGYDLPPNKISSSVRSFWPAVRAFGKHVGEIKKQ